MHAEHAVPKTGTVVLLSSAVQGCHCESIYRGSYTFSKMKVLHLDPLLVFTSESIGHFNDHFSSLLLEGAV